MSYPSKKTKLDVNITESSMPEAPIRPWISLNKTELSIADKELSNAGDELLATRYTR